MLSGGSAAAVAGSVDGSTFRIGTRKRLYDRRVADRGERDTTRPQGDVTGGVYPPRVHVLRDLGLDVEVLDDRTTRGRLAARVEAGGVGDESDGGPVVPFGVLATAVDVLGGAVCGRAISPDWMATSVMSLHLGPVDASREVVLDVAVLRAGRSIVTVEVDLRQESGAVEEQRVGSAVLTFSRLPRRSTTLVLPDSGGRPGDRYGFGGPSEHSGGITAQLDGFDAAIGCRRVDGCPGAIEADVSPYVRNSFGAVNGGVVAAVADAAGRSAVDRPGWRTLDFTANFLGQGREGPMVADATVVRGDDRSRTVRVDVTDAGQRDDGGAPRLMVVAHVVLGPG